MEASSLDTIFSRKKHVGESISSGSASDAGEGFSVTKSRGAAVNETAELSFVDPGEGTHKGGHVSGDITGVLI
jgi:hypothetical protein